MNNMFTDGVKRVMQYAREESARLGHNYIGTEHLLLGIIKEGKGKAVTVLQEALEVALDALDNLNASGKTIGVISHVEAMKERIPVQLRVHKGVGLGYSRLDARFAVKEGA